MAIKDESFLVIKNNIAFHCEHSVSYMQNVKFYDRRESISHSIEELGIASHLFVSQMRMPQCVAEERTMARTNNSHHTAVIVQLESTVQQNIVTEK